ncbi:MAG TPA: hypothetical protein VGW39_06375 [Chthoniobacterales bacterium]|nr:hypothetical protein [Chthoniobacterales bacterium]
MQDTTQNANTPFTVAIKAPGIDIYREVDETRGRRLIAILLGSGDTKEENEEGSSSSGSGTGKKESQPSTKREEFFAPLQNNKPSDNALAAAAYHYAQYGSAEFTVDEMRVLAEEVGITIPERLDMTYGQAKRKGNSLFRRSSRGAYRPTVHGESFFKQTYKVAKGTTRKPNDPSESN